MPVLKTRFTNVHVEPSVILAGQPFFIVARLEYFEPDINQWLPLAYKPIDVFIDGEYHTTVTTDADGQIRVAVPGLQAGSHTIALKFYGEGLNTVIITAVADGTPVNVKVTGVYPTGEWETPATITVPPDAAATFRVPTRIVVDSREYVFYGMNVIEGEGMVTGMGEIKFMPPYPAEAELQYRKSTAKWVIRFGDALVEVYDARYWRDGDYNYVYVRFAYAGTSDYPSVALFYKDSKYHGFYIGSYGTGYHEVTWRQKYYYGFYGIQFSVVSRRGTMYVAGIIRAEEMEYGPPEG